MTLASLVFRPGNYARESRLRIAVFKQLKWTTVFARSNISALHPAHLWAKGFRFSDAFLASFSRPCCCVLETLRSFRRVHQIRPPIWRANLLTRFAPQRGR